MNTFANNPLRSRADVARLAVDLIKPLIPCLSEGKARLHLGDTGAPYDAAVAGYDRGEMVEAEANTNLIHPRTLIPSLMATLEPGGTRLVCTVCALEDDRLPDRIPREVMKIAEQCL